MSGELYRYDERLGLFGHESRARLAEMVMTAFTRHEAAQIDVSFIENLGESSNLITPMIDQERIGSLVESDDAYMGYGLVTPQLDEANELGGIWYRVKRDGAEPSIIESKIISFPRSTQMDERKEHQEVDQLTFQFDKLELESLIRMLSKMTKRLQASRPSGMRETESPSYSWLQLITSAPVEEDVLYAIKTDNIHELGLVFPEEKTATQKHHPDQPGTAELSEIQHISDWAEFGDSVRGLLKREADANLPVSHINVRHEYGNKTYYVKLIAEYGDLSAAQILCDDDGMWRSQKFDLGMDDDDGLDSNLVNDMWDQDGRAGIIESIRHGGVIDNETYEGYRSAAENSLKAAFEASSSIVQLRQVSQKRPAA